MVLFLVEVFYELVGQFYCILFYVVDVGYVQFVDVGQQLVQFVVYFMEQCGYFVVVEGGWFVVGILVEVVYQVDQWCLYVVVGVYVMVVVIIYLCFVVFVFVCVQVQVELVDQCVLCIDQVEEVYIFVLYWCVVFLYVQVVQLFDY